MKKIKLEKKIIEWLEIEYILSQVPNVDIMVNYTINKNLLILNEELEPIKKLRYFTEKFDKVMEEVNKIKLSFAEKNEAGDPILTDNKELKMSDEQRVLLNKKLDEFFEIPENAKARDEQDKIFNDYNKLISEKDLQFSLYKIDISKANKDNLNKKEIYDLLKYCIELIEA